MIKIALLLRKKSGTTREQFIDYYENKHVPLIMKLTGGICSTPFLTKAVALS